VRSLAEAGWTIANHTFDHRLLSTLSGAEVRAAVEENQRWWAGRGLVLARALAYPNGASKDVGAPVEEFMKANAEMKGFFCNGGVNLRPERTQWLRLFAGDDGVRSLVRTIRTEAVRSRIAHGAPGAR